MAQRDIDNTLSRPARVVLASTSPRRRDLIGELDLRVDLAAAIGTEGPRRGGETPEDYVLRLSAEKAMGVAGKYPDTIVIGADTAVVLGGDVLGKPADEDEAWDMLLSLRGRTHTVITGVTVVDSDAGRQRGAVRSSEVVMRSYDEREISDYVASGESADKAGAYAVQDEDFRPASVVRGCYPNVVGFPLCDVVKLLADLGVDASIRHGSQATARCDDCLFEGTSTQ